MKKIKRICIDCKKTPIQFQKHSRCTRCAKCQKVATLKIQIIHRNGYHKKWCAENRKHLRKYKAEYAKQWRKKNPEKDAANQERHRKRIQNSKVMRDEINKRSREWKIAGGQAWKTHQNKYSKANRTKRLYGEYAKVHRILINLEKDLAKRKKKVRAA